jgi:hypothetical protein
VGTRPLQLHPNPVDCDRTSFSSGVVALIATARLSSFLSLLTSSPLASFLARDRERALAFSLLFLERLLRFSRSGDEDESEELDELEELEEPASRRFFERPLAISR